MLVINNLYFFSFSVCDSNDGPYSWPLTLHIATPFIIKSLNMIHSLPIAFHLKRVMPHSYDSVMSFVPGNLLCLVLCSYLHLAFWRSFACFSCVEMALFHFVLLEISQFLIYLPKTLLRLIPSNNRKRL